MAQYNSELITALRETARRLKSGARYEWGHMGRCNCGHLVQTVTGMSDVEIVKSIDFKLDEWTEHARDYCRGTGGKVDEIFEQLKMLGFSREDVLHLEYLSDPQILGRLNRENKHLSHNNIDDVIEYMETMADVLGEKI